MCVECNKNNRYGSKLDEWHSDWVPLQIKLYREKSQALWTKHSTTVWTLVQKLLDRDKTGLMLSQTFISIECCPLLITQFHTSIKISVMGHLFQKQDILGTAVNVQQH